MRWALAIFAVVVAGIAAFLAFAWRPALDPVAAPGRDAFDPQLVARGRELAAVGDCAGCHTRPGGAPFAGGVALATPFGTLFGTNITPDPKFGIGNWSEAAFRRAMREGVARDGRHLYPAFPYGHFTLLDDADIAALYAYFMTREPVNAAPPEHELAFPFNLRPLLAGWKRLYFEERRFQADASKSAQWNRGAYLVRGLGHCGACHTPRNRLGAEHKHRQLAGALVEGWYAPALNEASPSPIPWTPEDLATYLATGIAERHAMAAGPMQTVTHELGRAAPEDVRAIAAYIHGTMGPLTQAREARARAAIDLARREPSAAAGSSVELRDARLRLGKALYLGACASCHERGRELSSGGALELPLAVALYEPEPASLVNIIRDGIQPPPGETGRWMPGFAGAFNEEQMLALLTYLRTLAPGAPPWQDLE
ncbi:MAG TPA: c-type cytochrome [Burkholderiales bacterium]